VPTADFFAQLRTSAAARDLRHHFLDDEDDDNGLERFIIATPGGRTSWSRPAGTGPFPLLELS
jgi:hypothetical protein